MSREVAILEYTAAAATLKVDREKGIIYGAKVLGERSANPPPNDNEYPQTTREKAIKLIEGSRSYINHPAPNEVGKTRRYEDSIGVHRNVHEKGDGLYSNFHYNPKHPLAEQIAWDAENAPENFGFSINGAGKSSRQNGRNLVEEITVLRSVDLVSRPGTTKGLFESLELPMTTTLKALLESLKGKPQAVALREMTDAAGMPPDSPMLPGSDSPDDAIKAGFKAAIHAVVDDDSMDMQAKLSKIKEILKAQEKLMGGGEKPVDKTAEKPAEEGKNPPTPTPGEVALREELDRLKRKDRARELCEDAGVKPSATLLKALVALPDEADVKALVEEHRAAKPTTPPGNNKPRSGERAPAGGKPITESASDKVPTETKALARWLKE